MKARKNQLGNSGAYNNPIKGGKKFTLNRGIDGNPQYGYENAYSPSDGAGMPTLDDSNEPPETN